MIKLIKHLRKSIINVSSDSNDKGLFECKNIYTGKTCPLFGGSLHSCFTIFLYLNEAIVISEFGSSVMWLDRRARLTNNRAIV